MKTLAYVIDLDERGEFKAHVEDREGKEVFSYSTEDGSAQQLCEDGYLTSVNDHDDLGDYLKEQGIVAGSFQVLPRDLAENAWKETHIKSNIVIQIEKSGNAAFCGGDGEFCESSAAFEVAMAMRDIAKTLENGEFESHMRREMEDEYPVFESNGNRVGKIFFTDHPDAVGIKGELMYSVNLSSVNYLVDDHEEDFAANEIQQVCADALKELARKIDTGGLADTQISGPSGSRLLKAESYLRGPGQRASLNR